MKKYIAVLELEADEKSIEADIRYNYSSDGEDYSVLDCVWFNEENKEQNMKTYEDGLNEAWKTARKIACAINTGGDSWTTVEKIFDSLSISNILCTNTASEAIAKIKEYEENKVGDEVEYNNEKGIILEFDDDSATIMKPSGRTVIVYNKGIIKKTGRHFSQIEEVLKQMKEGEDE